MASAGYNVSLAFRLILAARLIAAFFSNVSDCDETFNYWEPTHFLMYGTGFQTWEYSPTYAIRSYGYVMLHALPGFMIHLLTSNKVAVFYGIRCCLAVVCSLCETYLYRSVLAVFGSFVAHLLLTFLLFSSGMFISSTAYLPSTFSMYCIMVSTGAWLTGNIMLAVFTIAVATIIGWPFSGALGLPLALNIVIGSRKSIWDFTCYSCISAVLTVVPSAIVDYYFYRRLVIAALNIILYNVFGTGGPDLYGVEPWTFYFVNGFLNFNVVFLFGVMSAVIWVTLAMTSRLFNIGSYSCHGAMWKCVSPVYIWIVIFFTQPHKEERFLFPIYPLLCLAAAVAVNMLQDCARIILQKLQITRPTTISALSVIPSVTVTLFILLSISRSFALFKGYHGPLALYSQLYDKTIQLPEHGSYNVCIGKEWYRFPSHFFVPSNKIQVHFIQSSFRGQLPKHYSNMPDATWKIPPEMNDINKEEPGRYVNVSSCQYLVDWDKGMTSEEEPNYSEMASEWKIIASVPFLDASRSNALYRAFYVPVVSEKETVYGSYNLLQRVK